MQGVPVTAVPCLCMLPVAVARPFYDGVAIRYVLPVIRMTSRLVGKR